MRLAILTSHPIQYYAPLFREVAGRTEVKVFFAHRVSPLQQAAAGFGTTFDWDVDLLAGYEHEFLDNVAPDPGVHHFSGCDTPEIALKLSKNSFDALLVTGWHLKSYWQGIWAAKRSRLPVMVRGDSHLGTPRSLAKRVAKRAVYPPMLRMFDAALYVGQRNLAYWRHYSYPESYLFYSPHCVDNDFFNLHSTSNARAAVRARFGVPESASVALFAGKLVPFKRPVDAIRAAAKVRAQGLDLHIMVAGSGELEQALRLEAEDLRVPTHFMGFQNQSEMPAAYAAADMLVLPSDGRESWGLVANEALACGKPVVVSNAVGCAPDLTCQSAVGATFPMGDVEALADALAKIAREPRSLEAIKDQATRYSLAAAANGIVSALSQVKRKHA